MPRKGAWRPSRGCQECKKSHTKCDEARPACGKCVKTKKVCSGYAEGLDLVLRDQNDIAKAQVNKRQKASSKSQCQDEDQVPDRQIVPHAQNPFNVSFLAESEETHAVAFFISMFALYPRDSQADRGFVEFVPLLCDNLRVGSPLSLTLTAASHAIYSKWERRRKDAETLSFPYYGRALQATRKALADPNERMSDETLMAVCLLGFYEASVNAFNSKISPARHFDGAAALIKQRRNGQMTDLSKKLLVSIRSNIIFRAMQFSDPVDQDSDILNDGEGVPQNPGTLLDLMSVEVANLLASAEPLFPRNPVNNPDEADAPLGSFELLLRAQEVDANLATWPSIVPPDWIPVAVHVDSVPKSVVDAGFYGDTCDIYPDIIICSTWNEWRVARLMVLGLIARIDHHDSQAQAIQTIQYLVDGICASIPFSLGDRMQPVSLYGANVQYPGLHERLVSKAHQKSASAYGGWYLFAPLIETMRIWMLLREGQREWLGLQLRRLAIMHDVTTW